MVEETETKTSFAEEMAKKKTEMDAAMAEADKRIAEMKELTAKDILGGRADAGTAPEVKKEETPEEYKDRILAGGI